jgi:hypothetical protein
MQTVKKWIAADKETVGLGECRERSVDLASGAGL